MVFKEEKWENICDTFYKSQLSGLNVPCLKDYNPLLLSVFKRGDRFDGYSCGSFI